MDARRERGLMGRLRRFEDHRFVGTRDTMRVYDCDEDGQFAALEARASQIGNHNLFQTFGPDTLIEAANRGFRPAVPTADLLN
ncbi:MAG: hypothetical protein WD532_04245 [Acidimicrobiia bacterium]